MNKSIDGKIKNYLNVNKIEKSKSEIDANLVKYRNSLFKSSISKSKQKFNKFTTKY